MNNSLAPNDNLVAGGTIGAPLEQAPSIVMTELQTVEQLVYNLYGKLENVITPVPQSTQSEPTNNLLSSRLRLISSTLEYILVNIEL
jgi:hypothetical protein